MTTYAIGDVHGCFSTLEGLLGQLDFDQRKDRLWLVGDLVNRGPRSLETLRWAKRASERLDGRFVTVLGNHDLHLVAVHRGWSRTRRKDTLDEVLAAADRAELIDWLAVRPVLYRQQDYLLVHAGLLPQWSAAKAEERARQVEAALAKPEQSRQLLRRAGQGADESDPLWRSLAAFTRMRALTPSEEFCDYTGPPDETPAGCTPWFERADRKTRGQTVIAGHWAAMGLRLEEGLVALDSGAAWGGPLSALRLDDGTVFQEPNRDRPAAR